MSVHSATQRLWLVPLLCLLLLTRAGPAWAAGSSVLEIRGPERVNLGDEVEVTAILTDGTGTPLPGATIILWSPGAFLSTAGAMELGRAVTDSRGRAIFPYQARSEDSVTLYASFPGDSRNNAAQVSIDMEVQGSTQLYRSSAGVRLPGIGVWLLVGLLSIPWSIYVGMMVLLALIAREGRPTPHVGGGADA